jgi:heat shock protein HtpX
VFLSRVVGYAVDTALRRNDEENTGPGMGYYITSLVLDILLGFLAGMIVAWFSRQREFRADSGSAHLLGSRQPMIHALARLGQMQAGTLPSSVAAMGITGDLGKLFASHPPLEERIAALQSAQG